MVAYRQKRDDEMISFGTNFTSRNIYNPVNIVFTGTFVTTSETVTTITHLASEFTDNGDNSRTINTSDGDFRSFILDTITINYAC